MSHLGGARDSHACCAVRGGVVLLGGGDVTDDEQDGKVVSTVEVLRSDSHTFTNLPPLSCGPRSCSTALPIDESESAEGQVLLLGGCSEPEWQQLDVASRVVKVDLATGACTPHPPLLYERRCFAAARLPDGRVVCAGGRHQYVEDPIHHPASITAEVLENTEQDGVWQWRGLPHMSVRRFAAAGCLLSDGHFAVFGGLDINGLRTTSCEVLILDGDERWEPLPPMLEARHGSKCAAVGGCVIIAGGWASE
jgi:hypothetical protein